MKLDYIDRNKESLKNAIRWSNYEMIHKYFYGQCTRYFNRGDDLDIDSIVEYVTLQFINDGSYEINEIKTLIREDLINLINLEMKSYKTNFESDGFRTHYKNELSPIVHSAINKYHDVFGITHDNCFKNMIQNYVELTYRFKKPKEYIENEKLIKLCIDEILNNAHRAYFDNL